MQGVTATCCPLPGTTPREERDCVVLVPVNPLPPCRACKQGSQLKPIKKVQIKLFGVCHLKDNWTFKCEGRVHLPKKNSVFFERPYTLIAESVCSSKEIHLFPFKHAVLQLPTGYRPVPFLPGTAGTTTSVLQAFWLGAGAAACARGHSPRRGEREQEAAHRPVTSFEPFSRIP